MTGGGDHGLGHGAAREHRSHIRYVAGRAAPGDAPFPKHPFDDAIRSSPLSVRRSSIGAPREEPRQPGRGAPAAGQDKSMSRTGPVHQISQKTNPMNHPGTAPDESRSARLAGNCGTSPNRSPG